MAHAEGRYRSLPFSQQRVREYVVSTLGNSPIRCLFVACVGSRVIGLAGAYIDDYLFCDLQVACDSVVFVHPHYRGTTTGKRLISALASWAVERGAHELCLSISSGINPVRTGRLYERLGFAPIGHLYRRTLGSA